MLEQTLIRPLQFYQDSWLNLVDAIASLVEKDSDFVFDALDGKTKPSITEGEKEGSQVNGNGKASRNQINYREEPVAFFFVLFGLVFEALVSQSNAPESQTLEVLQALRKIMHPSVAGNAVYQEAVFSETIDTLDRLVMTKGHGVQTVIVEIARNLSIHHQSATRGESTEHLSDDIEQLFELARNIILVLAGILPNLGESSPHGRLIIPDEAAVLIRLAFSSLVDVTSVFPSIIRADLHACILHIFSTMLSTGVCQAEIVPQALPTFRRFIQGIAPPIDISPSMPSEDFETLSQQIRGCVSRFLSIQTVAQRRESESSLPCAKNTLLSLTILLTTSSHIIPPQDPLIPQALNEMIDCLQDMGLATVAAGCIRSLLLNPAPRCATDDVIARFLFPRLVGFITGLPRGAGEDVPIDPENVRPIITHALVSCVGSATISLEATPSAVSFLVSALLARARREGAETHQELATRLLELAKTDPATFRGVVGTMDAEMRGLTEEILRSAGGDDAGKNGSPDVAEEQEKTVPSIELRMDF